MAEKRHRPTVDKSKLVNSQRLIDAIRDMVEYVVDKLEVQGPPTWTDLPPSMYQLLHGIQKAANKTNPQSLARIPIGIHTLVIIRPVRLDTTRKDFALALSIPAILDGKLRVIRAAYDGLFDGCIDNYIRATNRDVAFVTLEDIATPHRMRFPLPVALYLGLCSWSLDAYLELKAKT